MYEEEDDDLPSQYRRLTAHLQTGSADFNRRLAAYLTNHVAMRTALNEAINGNFSTHYPNAPQFAHNNTMFPSPMQGGFGGQMQSPTAMSPHTPSHPYRHAPYPMPGQANYRPNQQQAQQSPMTIQLPPQGLQAPSNMVPQTPGGHMQQALQQNQQLQALRRSSMPVAKQSPDVKPVPEQLPSPKSETSPRAGSPADGTPSKPSSAPASVANFDLQQSTSQSHAQSIQRQSRPQYLPNFPTNPYSNNNSQQQQREQSPLINPLTMTLPPESQQMINPSALPQNDFGAALMGGNGLDWTSFSESFGASDAGSMFKPGANFYPNMTGMSMTLAPEQTLKSNIHAGTMGGNVGGIPILEGASTPGANFDMNNFFNFGSDGSRNASAVGTPGDNMFKEFTDGDWAQSTT